jgi:hypothetical protein
VFPTVQHESSALLPESQYESYRFVVHEKQDWRSKHQEKKLRLTEAQHRRL